MQCEAVLSELGLADAAETVQPGWEESRQSLPAGDIEFLTADFVRAACAEFGVTGEDAEAAVAMARRVETSPALRAFAWHYHQLTYGETVGGGWERMRHWPTLEAVLGSEAGLFDSVVFLSGLPRMHREHRAHRVPEDVIRDTLSDVHLGLQPREGRRRGMSPMRVGWYSNFLRADLYRMVRLQFQFGKFWARLRVYRHAAGAVLALSTEGVRYRPDGQLAREGETEGVWTATLEEDVGAITGYPVLPAGAAAARPVTLPKAEWRLALSDGDPVLRIHIPGGNGPMSHDLCGASFRKAMEFFPRHYPDFHYKAFCCHSWILDTWLQQALPAEANMPRLQREVYLHPVGLGADSVIDNLFGGRPEDLNQAPRETRLQRAVLDALAAGALPEPGAGGCFLFPEDFRWGEEVYRNQRLPADLLELER